MDFRLDRELSLEALKKRNRSRNLSGTMLFMAMSASLLMSSAGAIAENAVLPPSEVGKKVFLTHCVRCHGVNLVAPGNLVFDLRTFPADEKERFVTSVQMGKLAMPAWGSILKEQDIEALWAYIGSVNQW